MLLLLLLWMAVAMTVLRLEIAGARGWRRRSVMVF